MAKIIFQNLSFYSVRFHTLMIKTDFNGFLGSWHIGTALQLAKHVSSERLSPNYRDSFETPADFFSLSYIEATLDA